MNKVVGTSLTYRLWSIGHFRIILGLFFKASPGAHPFIWKLVFIHMQMKTNFHMKRWAPGLALKKRPKVIRKWPITTHNLLFSSFSYKQPFQKENELGTSSVAMFSHYTAVKIKHKCFQFFFLQVMQMQPVSFSLKLWLISHLNSVQDFFFIQALS